MATDLNDLIPALQRSVSVPGTFATDFPSTSDTDLLGTLLDAFGEAQLDGFFATYTSDDEGLLAETLTRAESALIVIYASCRILQSEMRNRKSHKRYEAGSVVFEEDQAASTLTELLKEYQARKKELRDQGLKGDAGAAFYMADAYVMRAIGNDYWL